jgi:hypothetical protein
LAAYYLRNFDDCRVTARQIKGYPKQISETSPCTGSVIHRNALRI